jgi:hypothetical protein
VQEVALYDPNRKPASWMEIIQPRRHAAFLIDIETGAEMTGDRSRFDNGMTRCCLLFDSLGEAEQYFCAKPTGHNFARPRLSRTPQRRMGKSSTSFGNRRYQRRLDFFAQLRRLMRWGLAAIAASFPLFWFAWARRSEEWTAAFLGLQMVFAGLRFFIGGYNLGEELRYQKAQSNLREQQNNAMTGRSGIA